MSERVEITWVSLMKEGPNDAICRVSFRARS
jgi:hypothetical protein